MAACRCSTNHRQKGIIRNMNMVFSSNRLIRITLLLLYVLILKESIVSSFTTYHHLSYRNNDVAVFTSLSKKPINKYGKKRDDCQIRTYFPRYHSATTKTYSSLFMVTTTTTSHSSSVIKDEEPEINGLPEEEDDDKNRISAILIDTTTSDDENGHCSPIKNDRNINLDELMENVTMLHNGKVNSDSGGNTTTSSAVGTLSAGTVSDEQQSFLPFMSKPLTYSKYLTMQKKRVIITIRYSEGLRPLYLTVAKKIKSTHPDVVIEKRIFSPMSSSSAKSDTNKIDNDSSPSSSSYASSSRMIFEVLVDGKVVIRNNKNNRGVNSNGNTVPAIFISMNELDICISKARRKRRPTTNIYAANTNAALAVKKLKQRHQQKRSKK